MRAKDVEFEVTFINLRDKPDWFLKISPHSKVPVLKVDEEILFRSNAIAEFLDETVPPVFIPSDPVERARNRAWTISTATFSSALNGIYYTKTCEEMEEGLAKAPKAVERLEEAFRASAAMMARTSTARSCPWSTQPMRRSFSVF